jgi:hypothetical protein
MCVEALEFGHILGRRKGSLTCELWFETGDTHVALGALSDLSVLCNSTGECVCFVLGCPPVYPQVRHQKGVVHWKELLECEVRLPVDPRQMPDTFIYLCRGPKGNDRWAAQAQTRVVQ